MSWIFEIIGEAFDEELRRRERERQNASIPFYKRKPKQGLTTVQKIVVYRFIYNLRKCQDITV